VKTLFVFHKRRNLWSAVPDSSYTTLKKEVFHCEPKGDEGANLIQKWKDFDVNDLLYRNMGQDNFNINDQLQRIKAKTMIVHVKTDQWLRYAMPEEAAKKIPGAKVVGYDHPLAHYGAFAAFAIMKNDVAAFFKEIGME